MGRGDPKSGRKHGTRYQGTRWFWRDKSRNQNDTILACLAPYKPKSETKPIQYMASNTKIVWSENTRYQGPKCPVTQDSCFHDLHKLLNNFCYYKV